MRRAFALLVLLTPVQAWAEARLPGGVAPTEIRVAIEPDANKLKFRGTVTLHVHADKALDKITMNAAELKIARATIDGTIAKAVLDDEAETLTLVTGRKLVRGPHKIEITYEGTVKQQPAGLFAVDYPAKDGSKKRMLATQFEATDARRMLPCFDEPAYKARYHVTVTVPKKQLAISNMPEARRTDLPDGRTRIEFAPTPQMSSYLLFLAAGEFDTISQRVDGRLLRVVTVQGEAAKGKFALDLAARLLPFYESYFAQRYPLPKLDLFAVPASGGFGAMENWGALLFFERWVLFDPSTTAEAARQGVAVTVAHEMAHQWFGNLVTMKWWDDLWLNEGFASWMENYSVDALLPTWQIWLQTRRERESAMRLDARRGSHPVVQKVASANEANAAFDDITYRKGQAIVRMLESWLGPDPFRAGMRSWMREHAYGNASTDDLWIALERDSKFPVREVATSFTSQAGLPLIEASSRCDGDRTKLTLSQSRFSAGDANARAHSWSIPLILQPLGGKASRILLREARGEFDLPGCAPVIVNAGGVTWARVSYTPELRAVLTQRFAQLDAADQVTLLDDSWALVETGKLPADIYLALIAQLTPDAPLPVWQQATETIAEIDGWLRGTPGRDTLRNFARSKFGPALARLGWSAKPNEPTTDSLLRDVLIDALSTLDDQPTIGEAKRRFHDWAERGGDLPGSIRGVVLRATGRGADAREFEQLLAKAQTEQDHAQRQNLLTALAGVRDPQLAQRVLDTALADWVAPTARSTVVVQVAQAGEHAALAWRFAQAHYDQLVEPLDATAKWDFAASLVAGSSDAARAQELREFTETRIPADARQPVQRVVEEINFRADKKNRLAAAVEQWIAAHSIR
jgi:aminopeptidase N